MGRRQKRRASGTREGGTQGCGASRKGQQHPVASPAAVSRVFHRRTLLLSFSCGTFPQNSTVGGEKRKKQKIYTCLVTYAQLQEEFFSSDSDEGIG